MSLALNLSAFNRQRKWKIFQKKFAPAETTTILDVGFSDKEYSATDNFLEKNYTWPQNITALGVDQPREFTKRYPQVKTVHYDGHVFPFADKTFDIAWSNAVLEHVGDAQKQILFLKQIKRVAKHAFITTPNRYFPLEVHTRLFLLHFLPKKLFDRILIRLKKEWAAGDYMNLLNRRTLKKRLRAAGIKKYKIISNKILGFTLDFIVIF